MCVLRCSDSGRKSLNKKTRKLLYNFKKSALIGVFMQKYMSTSPSRRCITRVTLNQTTYNETLYFILRGFFHENGHSCHF